MWRFVHLSDPHLASERDGEWNNRFLCSMMPEVMDCLRRDLQEVRPAFILATGDIASQQTREAMFEASELMDSLGFPYYPMGGNHDFVFPDSRAWFLEAFAQRLPVKSTFYRFSHGGLHFLVLDAWWKWSDDTLHLESEARIAAKLDQHLRGARWAIPPAQLRWIEEQLESLTGDPVLIAVHFPALPVPVRLKRSDLKDGGCLENGEELLALLGRFPRVKAIFSGHVHMHFVERLNGITQVVTGALPEYPVEYRVVDVHADRLEVSTRALSDNSFALRSLIPGHEWTAGQPSDRTVTIRLD